MWPIAMNVSVFGNGSIPDQVIPKIKKNGI